MTGAKWQGVLMQIISAWSPELLSEWGRGELAADHVAVFARTPGTRLVDVFIRITDISGKIIGFSNSITGCIRPIIDRSIIKFSVLLVILRGGQTRQGRVSGLGQSKGCICLTLANQRALSLMPTFCSPMTTWWLVLGVFGGFVTSVGGQLKMVARSMLNVLCQQ